MITLPRGIQKLERTNKDGSKVVSFRVQMKRKNIVVDQLFPSADEAINFLNEQRAKLNLPRKLIEASSADLPQEVVESFLKDYFQHPNLGKCIDKYIEIYVTPRYEKYALLKTAEDKAKYRNYKNTLSFFKTIKNTKVRNNFQLGNMEIHFQNGFNTTDKKLGEVKVEDIDERTINSYIQTRATQGIKAQSIQREITFISNVFNKLKYISPEYQNIKNPTRDYDRDLLKLAEPSRKKSFRFTDERKEEFLKAIHTHENPDFSRIIELMLLTAMRRSEVVLLRWSQIKEDYIELDQTKTTPRNVFLTKEAKELIKSIPRVPNRDRLFKYTVLGFDGSYTKWLKDHDFSDITSHKLRKEAISNFVERIGAENSLLIAEILGISSVRKLEENIKQMPSQVLNQNDLLKNVGHSNADITKRHYFSLKKA